MDRLTKARRSWNMSRIRGKDTKPEKVVRSLLHRKRPERIQTPSVLN
jgi:DNA mismatch endonuclease (patch repair protein)